ncbi:MAG: hypothetical protein ACK4KV_10070 [Rhodocyclaceae bacterium]
MVNIANVLSELREELLDEEEPIEELESIILAIDDLMDQRKLSVVETEAIEQLPEARRDLFNELVYARALWDLYSDIAYDGLLSLFYNRTGAELDKLKAILGERGDAVASLFEEAYAVAAAAFSIHSDENWVMRNPGQQPHECLPEDVAQNIEAIEGRLGEMQEAMYARAVERAREMARRA